MGMPGKLYSMSAPSEPGAVGAERSAAEVEAGGVLAAGAGEESVGKVGNAAWAAAMAAARAARAAAAVVLETGELVCVDGLRGLGVTRRGGMGTPPVAGGVGNADDVAWAMGGPAGEFVSGAAISAVGGASKAHRRMKRLRFIDLIGVGSRSERAE